MSIETANAARYEKGMTVLTELEGELLELVETLYKLLCEKTRMHTSRCACSTCDTLDSMESAIQKAHGAEKGGE